MGQEVDATVSFGFEFVDYNKIQKSTHLTFIFGSDSTCLNLGINLIS